MSAGELPPTRRDRHTSVEIVAMPAAVVPPTPWRARVALLALILLLGGILLWMARWKPPMAQDDLSWEQIAPPPTVPMHPWRWIVIHHSASRSGNPQVFDNIHVRDNGWDGIGYHFVIGNGHPMPLGRIEATFRWRNQYHGAHAGNDDLNRDGIGICLVGDFEHGTVDAYQERRLVELCALLLDRIPTLSPGRLIGHRDVPGKQTACPGRNLDIERIRAQVRLLREPSH
jgi:hypothetical protein